MIRYFEEYFKALDDLERIDVADKLFSFLLHHELSHETESIVKWLCNQHAQHLTSILANSSGKRNEEKVFIIVGVCSNLREMHSLTIYC